jgi:hypothetical protein
LGQINPHQTPGYLSPTTFFQRKQTTTLPQWIIPVPDSKPRQPPSEEANGPSGDRGGERDLQEGRRARSAGGPARAARGAASSFSASLWLCPAWFPRESLSSPPQFLEFVHAAPVLRSRFISGNASLSDSLSEILRIHPRCSGTYWDMGLVLGRSQVAAAAAEATTSAT